MDARPTAEEQEAVDRWLEAHLPTTASEGSDHVSYDGFRHAGSRRRWLLPLLQEVQRTRGWISSGALNYISQRLIVPPADAFGVASFYALLSTTTTAPRVAHVCDDIVCRRRGADELTAGLEATLGPEAVGDAVAWKRSPCLGICERAPGVFVQRGIEGDVAFGEATTTTVLEALDGFGLGDETTVANVAPQIIRDPEPLRVLRRIGRIDPEDLDAYCRDGGFRALDRAIAIGPDAVLAELDESRLRGRGGAAYPIAPKWREVAGRENGEAFVVCNADESEPGTFKDRVLLEADPFAVVESLTIAGTTVGADHGYIYLRGEYPGAARRLRRAIEAARNAGYLGEAVMDSAHRFDIELRIGAGAYICGEETALFNSIEGYRGEPRQKPPFPTTAGLFGVPTVVNNVETLVNVLDIVLLGGERFGATGTAESTGTKLFCVTGDVALPGVYEVEFGATLGHLIELAGGPTEPLRAVLLGGAAGAFVSPDRLDLPLTFESARAGGLGLGSGAIVAFGSSTDFADVTQRIASFFRDESCGQCVPCRVGTVRQEEALVRWRRTGDAAQLDLLADIDMAMADSSICGLGQTAGRAIQSAIALGLLGDGTR